MFELSVAYKYLIPRWRQLSVSIISLVSTLVIALVVWLIVVFFSVKDGLENSWIDKITAITAPIRITPTEKYYQSYYFLADTISDKSGYTSKTIGEKLLSDITDPYDDSIDEEPPKEWPAPDRDNLGKLKDLVKTAFAASSSLPGIEDLKVSDFETTVANLRLRLLRNVQENDRSSQQFLEYAALIGSFDADTPSIAATLFPPTAADFNNLLHMQGILFDNIKEETPTAIHTVNDRDLTPRLESYFQMIEITALKTPPQGWHLPSDLLALAELEAAAVFRDNKITQIIVPSTTYEVTNLIEQLKNQGTPIHPVKIKIDNEGNIQWKYEEAIDVTQGSNSWTPLAPRVALTLAGNMEFSSQLIERSINNIQAINRLQFKISGKIQGYPLDGIFPLGHLDIAKAKIKNGPTPLLAIAGPNSIYMPPNQFADPILLPKGFKDSGALVGDQGYLSYYSPTPSAIQEQRIPVFVAGFYDPGIIPIGGKYILASRNLTALIRASYNQENTRFSNGINVRFKHINDTPKVKAELQKAFQDAGVAPYWQIETYQEYEFSKDIFQQLQSEKNLFSLISLVIIIVACSNIISMLIILVNDKKLEIGILRSMGASSASIATIFGICGIVMGTIGSVVGIFAAILTLRYVNELVGFMSRLQGHDLFNPLFYGTTLPTELSTEALLFVVMTTVAISLLAGVIPAFKASMMRPSAILRAE